MTRARSHARRALVVILIAAFAAPAGAQSGQDLFESRIRPLFAGKCLDCHNEVSKGGLRMSSREDLLFGGDSGPAIVPGDPEASLLISLVRHEEEGREMPLDEPPLTVAEIDALVEWIRMDAPWPEATATATATPIANDGLSPSARIFVDRVRPLLTQRCFACHTDDESGGLRLDSLERMLEGGGRGPAIVPGVPEGSLLIAAVRHANEDLQMPRNGARLSESEIAGLIDWIASGAEWADVDAPMAVPRRAVTNEERRHWAFRSVSFPVVPTPADIDWATTDIDRFVLAKLEEKGLTPAARADRRRLIRRASFDLIGLPPNPEEVEDFVDDDSPDAWEKVIDRLLASPHYGERWGRHWLDVARYAEDDTRGLAITAPGREEYPSAYVYRDWVIQAFNDDMPWDAFIKAQLAGDLIAEAEDIPITDAASPVRGLGFLGGGPWYYDIADPILARADERHDRVDVTTRGFLGLTVGCARCHDHKYDPIGIHDYYALAGVFNNTDYYEYPIAEEAAVDELERDKDFIEDLQQQVGIYRRTESEQLQRVLTMQIARYMMAAWQVIGEPQMPVVRTADRAKVDLELLQRYIRFLGKEPKHYPYLMPWQDMIARDGGTEEEARELADAFQRLVLEIVAERDEIEEKNKKLVAKSTPLEEVKSTPMPNGFESFFDLHQVELESMDPVRYKLWVDVFRGDLDNPTGSYDPQPALLSANGFVLDRFLSRTAVDHLEAMSEEIESLREDLPEIPFVMGVHDKDEEDLGDIALHIRGDPRKLGEDVPRSFLPVLSRRDPAPYTDGSGRLQLAEDIADHPLAARVIVNRVWAWHMGRGIVSTPSNFGFAGGPPSNPELLDYLTLFFVNNGQSIKALNREIMRSTVYQLDTERTAANDAIDEANTYFWRANRQRLDAEGIRDALLFASGELDAEIGGESMRLTDEENKRRTVYGWVSRFQLDEFLQTFDFPNPSLSAEKRHTTNVPLQSLYFMNSEFVQRQAEALVTRLATTTSPPAETAADAEEAEEGDVGDAEGEAPGDRRRSAAEPANRPEGENDGDEEPDLVFDDRAMIEMAYPLLYGRAVTEIERDAGLEFLAEQRASLFEKELDRLAEEEAEAAAQAERDAAMAAAMAGKMPGSETTIEPRQQTQRARAAAEGEGAGAEAEEADADEAAAEDEDPAVLAEKRAAKQAWIQYARALFSAAEFRYID